jgi:hypothetical protein
MTHLEDYFGSIVIYELSEADVLVDDIIGFMERKHPEAYKRMPPPPEAGDGARFSSYQDFAGYMYDLAEFFGRHDELAYLDYWFSMVKDDPERAKSYLSPAIVYGLDQQERTLEELKREFDFASYAMRQEQDQVA